MNLGLIPSVFLFFGVLSLFYAAALHYFLKIKDQQAVAYWSQGSFVWGCAILLTIFRQDLPLWLSYFAANGLAFVAYVEMNQALKVLIRPEPQKLLSYRRYGRNILIWLLYTVALYAVALGVPEPFTELAKTCFVSTLVLWVSLQGALYCLEIARVHHLKIARNFSAIYVLVAFLWLTRMLAAAAFQTPHAFDPAPVNTVIWLAMFLTGIIKYMVFPMLLLQKAENEKEAQWRSTLVKANKTATSGALSASIAHELNQPLAAIRINGQTLRNMLSEAARSPGGQSEAALHAIVNDILQDNERAAKIISSLRAIFTQSSSVQARIDATAVIRKSLDMVSKEVRRDGIILELALTEGLWVDAPADELHQVLLNLLFNSIQAFADRPESAARVITITARRQARRVELVVADNGPGIAPEMEGVLFELLSTSKDSGMGVGLWLCKYIVERHHGRISHSPAQGGGACFTIELPLIETPLGPHLSAPEGPDLRP